MNLEDCAIARDREQTNNEEKKKRNTKEERAKGEELPFNESDKNAIEKKERIINK